MKLEFGKMGIKLLEKVRKRFFLRKIISDPCGSNFLRIQLLTFMLLVPVEVFSLCIVCWLILILVEVGHHIILLVDLL